MKNRVRLFTVADPEIGLGHLFRCDALAFAFVQQNIPAELVVGCKAGIDWVREKPLYSSWRLRNWTNDADCIEKELEDCEIPVFDAYRVEKFVWDAVRNSNREVVVFDDYGEKPYFKGILINGSPGADLVGYKDLPDRQLLLGPLYQVLRPPFWEKTHRIIRRKVESVGIMLGGTDHRGLFPAIIKTVRNMLPYDVVIYVIGNNEGMSVLDNVNFTGLLDSASVKVLFDKLDLLFTAAGQTSAEAVSCALPVIVFTTAQNQITNFNGLLKRNLGIDGSVLLQRRLIDKKKLAKIMLAISDYSIRKEISEREAGLDMEMSTKRLTIRVKEIFSRSAL
jgi:spore coat polysaccharide biosynthesis predicted glycosyltransferase SpsG